MNVAEQIPAKENKRLAPIFPALSGAVLRRACSCGMASGSSGQCEECKKKKLQRRTASAGNPLTVPPIVHDVLNSPGQPLDSATRSFMEPRFGHDFGRIRVHTDERAAQSAHAVNALAYTVGSNVVFGAGQYTPCTPAGQKLLAHELTHVIQQRANEASGQPLTLGAPDDHYEREAERIASTVAETRFSAKQVVKPRGASVGNGGRSLLRVPGSANVIQRQVPTGIALKEAKPFGHADLKSDDDKKKYLTNIGNVSLLQLLPAGDYTPGKKKGDGECTKEFLNEVSNTCPTPNKPFCAGNRCLEVDRSGNAGDPQTGMMVTDGPDTFIDRHIARYDTSFLEGSGKKQCSVVCHQLYKYRTEPDGKYHELGAFYIIRNFKADTYTPKGSKTPINITTGSIQKIPAPSTVPTKDEFAQKTAPGLVKSGTLLDAPPAPQPPPPVKKADDKK